MDAAETLAELDLDEQRFGIAFSARIASSVVALDARLDRLDCGRERNGWSGVRGGTPTASDHPSSALGRVLSYPAAADDLLELSLDVWRRQGSPLVVGTTVVVQCFCDVDHGLHTAAEREWPASSDREVLDALRAAVGSLEAWAALGLNADGWRSRADLPARPASPGGLAEG